MSVFRCAVRWISEAPVVGQFELSVLLFDEGQPVSVRHVFLVGAVAKVAQGGVHFVAVQVTDLHAWRGFDPRFSADPLYGRPIPRTFLGPWLRPWPKSIAPCGNVRSRVASCSARGLLLIDPSLARGEVVARDLRAHHRRRVEVLCDDMHGGEFRHVAARRTNTTGLAIRGPSSVSRSEQGIFRSRPAFHYIGGSVQTNGRDGMPQHDELRLLLVDDDPAVLRAYGRTLSRAGVTVETASNGKEAADRVRASSFDVIVSDIVMPEMTGIEFLKAIRAHDLDVPVILITGEPSLESAVRAVEYGAFRYLAKPVAAQELWDTAIRAARLHKMAKLKREALELPGKDGRRLGERAALEVRFTWGMSLMWMAFQPIVGWRDRRIFGYEALLRSDEPLMSNPADILDAAERLGRLHELGRAVRAKVAAAVEAPESSGVKLFVNLHSADLNDEELYSSDAPLSKLAHRVVLEVTERASLYGVKNVADCVAKLKALGFQMAIDDLGAGYAGLTSFTQLEPEVAKLDMSLVRGVDADSRRQTIVRSMKKLCDELGIMVIAEGVETPAERDMLADLGCDLLQGYLFAKPGRRFDAVTW